MPSELTAETEALWRDVEDRVDDGRDGPRLRPMLVELARRAPDGSRAWAYACCELAERVMGEEPWHASVLARRVTRSCPEDHRGWGLLGLSSSLLGHHRFAVVAYRRALRLQPSNPWYAHNLGHLLDAVLGEPTKALPLLQSAYVTLHGWEADVVDGLQLERARQEVTSSLAHALLSSGDLPSARALMKQVIRGAARPEHHELYREILAREEAAVDAVAEREAADPGSPRGARRRPRKRRHTKDG